MKLGMLPVHCKPHSPTFIEASEVVYISPAANQKPDGPTAMIRLASGEEAYSYDAVADLAEAYDALVDLARAPR